MRLILAASLVLLFLPLAGCTSLPFFGSTFNGILEAVGQDPAKVVEIEDRAIDTAIGKPINLYCLATPDIRAAMRERINARPAMAGNQVAVHCAGDEPLELPMEIAAPTVEPLAAPSAAPETSPIPPPAPTG